MNRKKSIIIIACVIAFLVVVFFLVRFYPKIFSRLPALLLLFLTDVYLWKLVSRRINAMRKAAARAWTALFWLPFILLAAFSTTAFIYDYTRWNTVVRAYLLGFVLIIYLSKATAALFLLVYDFLRILASLVSFVLKKIKYRISMAFRPLPRSRWVTIICLCFGLFLFLTLAGGIFKGPYHFEVKNQEVVLKELPDGFDGIRILQISDLHLGNWLSLNKMKELADLVNKQRPDLVLFTGDLVNYRSDEAYPYESILSEIKAPMGTYCILGNHDYGDYFRWKNDSLKKQNYLGLLSFYKRIGWELLNNENRLLVRKMDTIALIGVENWGKVKRFPKRADMKKALKGTEYIPCKLLMSHDPSHWDWVVSKDYPDIALTFAGHTHGSQLGIQKGSVRWSPSKFVYKYWAGLYNLKHPGGKVQYLYVNTGIGMVVYPGRVGILPEITVFTIRNAIRKQV